MSEKALVFITCGQFTDDEISLGSSQLSSLRGQVLRSVSCGSTSMTPNSRPMPNESGRIVLFRPFRSITSSQTRTGLGGMKVSEQCQVYAFVSLRRIRSLGRWRYRS